MPVYLYVWVSVCEHVLYVFLIIGKVSNVFSIFS